MENIIIIAVLLTVLSLASLYICKAKKSGKKCIGCPHSCCGHCSRQATKTNKNA